MSSARGGCEHGPGITWLAERAGCTPEELVADPQRLASALSEAGGAVTDLVARLASSDDEERAEAERTAAVLRARFADASDPGERFRAQVIGALRDATARVRDQRPT